LSETDFNQGPECSEIFFQFILEACVIFTTVKKCVSYCIILHYIHVMTCSTFLYWKGSMENEFYAIQGA